MAEKYIIDTLVWRDFYEYRYSLEKRPLGKHAASFFEKVLKRKDTVLYSEKLAYELGKDYGEAEIEEMLGVLYAIGILVRIRITEAEYREAISLSHSRDIPFVDCLNAVHARNHGATLVSRDPHILEGLADICRSSRPESLL
jgi:predicted nucleic acid-binding protein